MSYLTAIVIITLSTGRTAGFKYRNIRDYPATIDRFERFASTLARFPGDVININYYDRDTHNFIRQSAALKPLLSGFTK